MIETREANVQLLTDAGFSVEEDLPVIRLALGFPPKLRPMDEIFGRLVAIKALWLWVDTHPESESDACIRAMVREGDLRRHLTCDERKVLDLSRDEAVRRFEAWIGWKNETCWALAWALGFPRSPSVFEGRISGTLGIHLMLQWLPNSAMESRALAHRCTLRGVDEVSALEDLFYCAHSAVHSASQLGADTVPDGFDLMFAGGCIHERRHALTWMLSPGVAWDDTDLSM